MASITREEFFSKNSTKKVEQNKDNFQTATQQGVKSFQAKNAQEALEKAPQEGALPTSGVQAIPQELQPQGDGAIPAETLTQAQTPFPTQPAPQLRDMSGVSKLEAANLQAQLDARRAEQRVAKEEQAVNQLFGAIGTESDFRRQQEIENGLDEKMAMLNDLTTQQIQNNLLGAADLMKIEVGAIGTRMSPSNMQRRLSVADRENAIRAMTIAAQAAQAQGLVQAAQAKIDSAVEAKYEPMKMELEQRKYMLERAGKFADGRQKEKFQLQMREIESEEKELEKAKDTMQTLLKNGAGRGMPDSMAAQLTALPETTTREEIFEKVPGARKYLESAEEVMRRQKIGLEMQKLNKELSAMNSTGARTGRPSGKPDHMVAGFANRTIDANRQVEEIQDNFAEQFAEVPFAPNRLKSADRKRYEQAKENFVTAVLRKESGAQISDEEFEGADQVYFPQPGDDAVTLRQKEMARNRAMNALIGEAGTAYGGEFIPLESMVDYASTEFITENTTPEDAERALSQFSETMKEGEVVLGPDGVMWVKDGNGNLTSI